MYPVLNEVFSHHIKQPLYDILIADIDNNNFMIKVNHSAYDILSRCNGNNSITDIKNKLFEEYDESMDVLSDFVDSFLDDSARYGHIYYIKDPQELRPKLSKNGAYDFWTPEYVVLELTYACPLRCKHCYQAKMTPCTMDDRLIEETIHELIDMGVQHVQLTGG